MIDRKILTAVLIGLAIVILGFFWKQEKIVIKTDAAWYENGGVLRAQIWNYSLKNICFSSCYPYYLESKDGDWESYHYQNCPDSNVVEKCLNPRKVKAFKLSLPVVKEGSHRIAIPMCKNCKIGEEFQETEKFYSNEFVIGKKE